MRLSAKAGTTGAVAALALGLGAAEASAYAITGGSYSGAATQTNVFTLENAYTFTCAANVVTVAGVADGTATTSLTPNFGGANACYFVLQATVTQSGPWNLTVTSGPHSGGWYHGTLDVPSGTTTAIALPSWGCTATMTGSQSFAHGAGSSIVRMRNVSPTGVEVQLAFDDFDYAVTGTCPYSSGSDGWYTTNAPITIPGVTVS